MDKNNDHLVVMDKDQSFGQRCVRLGRLVKPMNVVRTKQKIFQIGNIIFIIISIRTKQDLLKPDLKVGGVFFRSLEALNGKGHGKPFVSA